MDWEAARFNMIEQQIRPWNVLNLNVLNILSKIKREHFVPEQYREMSLVEMELPLSHGQKMWEPKLEARVVQDVELRETDRVLEIGTGTGYLAALMAQFCKQVYAVELHADLADFAKSNLAESGIKNVVVETGNAALGWKNHAPYDVIVAGGAYSRVPDFLFEQLNEGGRLFAVVGELPIMTANLFTKEKGTIQARQLFDTVLPVLDHAPKVSHFEF